MPSSSPLKIEFKVGNTYTRLDESKAKLDTTGNHLKVHDWTLFVDLEEGSDPNHVDLVKFDMNHDSFSPRIFQSHCPVPLKNSDGSTFWRFSTRQQTYGMNIGNISVIVRGRGGTNAKCNYKLESRDGEWKTTETFVLNERRNLRPFTPVKMWDHNFGVELELTASSHSRIDDIANIIGSKSNQHIAIYESWSEGKATSSHWKLVPDSSIACSLIDPDCNKFELVSPILMGGHGLNKCYHVLSNGVEAISSIKVNKSMGFHVHVDVSDISLFNLKKICQNFIKYEDVMDSFLPPSRRSDSEESKRYFKSNKKAIPGATNKDRHNLIKKCRTKMDLFSLMNPNDDRYYKLNFQNLVTGKQQTIEFRQHSSTSQYGKVKNWVRFCMALVKNSIRFRPPSPMMESSTLDEQFNNLFHYLIKDRYLKESYLQRRKDLAGLVLHEANQECCNGCSNEGICEAQHTRKRLRY